MAGGIPNTAASVLRKDAEQETETKGVGVALGAFMVESARWDLDNFEWQMQFCTSSTRFSSSVVLGFFFCCFLVVVGSLLFCWVFFVFQY